MVKPDTLLTANRRTDEVDIVEDGLPRKVNDRNTGDLTGKAHRGELPRRLRQGHQITAAPCFDTAGILAQLLLGRHQPFPLRLKYQERAWSLHLEIRAAMLVSRLDRMCRSS
ncbi:hypothetical protein A5633_20275 [Mycolicibacterium elephantis]|uniref:hypothetical protein n=1 Tax=Mycolicibacterium elephantis TaxID=81858 RepID=UPI0007EB5757|nr:hypothetical protein [Mycolicibacterium elephantis]OBA74850.1 hypothetical protein A5633_20275 [Mycolicibacterium elephantis]